MRTPIPVIEFGEYEVHALGENVVDSTLPRWPTRNSGRTALRTLSIDDRAARQLIFTEEGFMERKPRIVGEAARPIQPNMLVLNADGASSTLASSKFSHSIFTKNAFFNSRFHESNFEGTAFDGCDFDGATFSNCSLRGVELSNCDVDHLVINGINVGNLLRVAMGDLGSTGGTQ